MFSPPRKQDIRLQTNRKGSHGLSVRLLEASMTQLTVILLLLCKRVKKFYKWAVLSDFLAILIYDCLLRSSSDLEIYYVGKKGPFFFVSFSAY